MPRSLATVLACLLLDTAANGATVCVNPGGTGGCFASVQGAVDAAASGDTITIAAGTYVENVLIDGKRLDIVGDDPTTTLIVENGCPFTGSTTLDITGQDPLLGPLQNNGGYTFTRVPGGGSPAIGAVDRERTCHNIDQFGAGRAPLPCDIGAIEAP